MGHPPFRFAQMSPSCDEAVRLFGVHEPSVVSLRYVCKMKTTFVLGAGASKGIGYPLASDLGAGLFRHMSLSSNEWLRDAADFLASRYGAEPDIEELLETIKDRVVALAESDSYELKVEREVLKNAQPNIGYALIDWFRTIRENPASNYAAFAKGVVASGDSIITFNYDDSLERELAGIGKWSVGRGYGFDLDAYGPDSGIVVLKLHGSMNWLASLFGGRTRGGFICNGASLGSSPTIHQIDLDFLGCKEFRGRIFPGGVAFPLLILPYKKKKFGFDTSFGIEFVDFWDSLWSRARDDLKTSDRVVIIGYSLLPVDQRARAMLLEDAPKGARVEIVCGSQSNRIADDYRAHGFSDIVAFGGYFADWLAMQAL
jgi:hypothetical protein